MDINTTDISLLYPDQESQRERYLSDSSDEYRRSAVSQLELDVMFDMAPDALANFFTTDPEVVKYRQETFADLMEAPELCDVLRRMIPMLQDIAELRRMGGDFSSEGEGYLYSVAEAEIYLSILDLLRDGLLPHTDKYKSRAMVAFADRIRSLTESDDARELNERLSELGSKVREIKSVTIGVNLDSRLKPEDAGVLSINNQRFKSGELLDRILRLDFKSGDMTCIAPLTPLRKNQTENEQTAMSNAFTSAIANVFHSSVRQWKKIVQAYVLDNTDFLLRMMPEIEFVTKSVKLLTRLKDRGCSLCTPEIRPDAEKRFDAVALINPVIALKVVGELVPNDFAFDDQGMIYVITGPNRGGKSVITCAVGHAFIMAQLGLPVCADKAVISPCDNVFTHFPTGSEDTVDKGRLGEECARLNEIFVGVTDRSLVLLDESLSSTGSFEGSYIAAEVLSGFSMAGCRGIFSTHLHDLAASVSSINERCVADGGVKIDNLSADISDGKRSFRIVRRTPDGKSYARDIAEKYGLSFENIIDTLNRKKD